MPETYGNFLYVGKSVFQHKAALNRKIFESQHEDVTKIPGIGSWFEIQWIESFESCAYLEDNAFEQGLCEFKLRGGGEEENISLIDSCIVHHAIVWLSTTVI